MTFSKLDNYMTEVVSQIELRFGGASSEWRQEISNKRAIECDVSVERVLNVDFEDMLKNTWMREDKENLFELLILIKTGEKVKFKWIDDDKKDTEYYFELRILEDEITKDVSLMVIDFAEEEELDESKKLWENQVSDLKHVIGSV